VIVTQIFIGCCGVTAVFLSQSKSFKRRRWACIFGLVAQPAWFYETWEAQQYGIFALTWVYFANWLRGFWNHWVVQEEEEL